MRELRVVLERIPPEKLLELTSRGASKATSNVTTTNPEMVQVTEEICNDEDPVVPIFDSNGYMVGLRVTGSHLENDTHVETCPLHRPVGMPPLSQPNHHLAQPNQVNHYHDGNQVQYQNWAPADESSSAAASSYQPDQVMNEEQEDSGSETGAPDLMPLLMSYAQAIDSETASFSRAIEIMLKTTLELRNRHFQTCKSFVELLRLVNNKR